MRVQLELPDSESELCGSATAQHAAESLGLSGRVRFFQGGPASAVDTEA